MHSSAGDSVQNYKREPVRRGELPPLRGGQGRFSTAIMSGYPKMTTRSDSPWRNPTASWRKPTTASDRPIARPGVWSAKTSAREVPRLLKRFREAAEHEPDLGRGDQGHDVVVRCLQWS